MAWKNGKEKGIYDANIANARKMKSLGFDIAVISPVAGLTRDTLATL